MQWYIDVLKKYAVYQYGPDPKAAERFGQPGAGPAEPGYPTV